MVSLSHFDDLISSMSLLKHPFYQKWNRGELTLEDLKVYAKEYYHLVKRVPGIVSHVRDRAIEREATALVKRIGENISEEMAHVGLWEEFARSMGVTDEELADHETAQMVKESVQLLESMAEDGTLEEGIAALYALERELPAIAQTKKDGLCTFYGIRSEGAHRYFDEHLKEAKHLRVWLDVKVDEVEAEPAVRRSLMAQNKLLDGVCQVCGIDIDCVDIDNGQWTVDS